MVTPLIPFTPTHLSMSRATMQAFPKADPVTAFRSLGVLRVEVNEAIPDNMIAVVGPPKDPHGYDPLDWMPQIVILDLRTSLHSRETS